MKLSHLLSLFLTIFFIGVIQAQTVNKDLYVEYEVQFNISELGDINAVVSNVIRRYKYQYSNGISCYKYIGERKIDPSIQGEFKPGKATTFRDFTQRYEYKQHDVHLEWIARDTLLFDKKWEIHFNESKVIMGYTCIKATSADSESGETVWFCKDLPVPDGPLGNGGLPGLVLAVEGSKISIVAVKVDAAYSSDPIVLPVLPVRARYLTFEEFNAKLMSRN